MALRAHGPRTAVAPGFKPAGQLGVFCLWQDWAGGSGYGVAAAPVHPDGFIWKERLLHFLLVVQDLLAILAARLLVVFGRLCLRPATLQSIRPVGRTTAPWTPCSLASFPGAAGAQTGSIVVAERRLQLLVGACVGGRTVRSKVCQLRGDAAPPADLCGCQSRRVAPDALQSSGLYTGRLARLRAAENAHLVTTAFAAVLWR